MNKNVNQFIQENNTSNLENLKDNLPTQHKTEINPPVPSDYLEEILLPSNLLAETEGEFLEQIKGQNIHKLRYQKTFNEQKNCMKRDYNYYFFKGEIKQLLFKLKTHNGSVYLQNSLSFLNDSQIHELFIRLYPQLFNLMCSHYGNYFIQKLFQKLSIEERLAIFNLIKYNFLRLCSDNGGTYSIQSLIDAIKTEKEEKILELLLCQNLLFLINNENAYHIIQKIIIDFPEHKREYLNNFIISNIDKICGNEYGNSCLVKLIIMNSNLQIRINLIKAIEKNIYCFLNNKFGVTALVLVLQKFSANYTTGIVNEIKKNLIFYVTHEGYMLNLLKKVINLLYKSDIREFINLTWSIFKNDKMLNKMVKCENGLILLVDILKLCNNEQKIFFMNKNIVEKAQLEQILAQ